MSNVEELVKNHTIEELAHALYLKCETYGVYKGTDKTKWREIVTAEKLFHEVFEKISAGKNSDKYGADAYDPSTNQRFTVPSGKAGKYYIHGKIFYNDINSTDAYEYASIYKNGSEFARGQRRTVGTTGRDATVSVSEILNLSVGDYIEIYGNTNAGSGSLNGDSRLAVFEGYKLVE